MYCKMRATCLGNIYLKTQLLKKRSFSNLWNCTSATCFSMQTSRTGIKLCNIEQTANFVRLFSNDESANDLKVNSESKLHIAPKMVLNNIYNVVAQDLKNIDLQIRPSFTVVKMKNNTSSWTCTYHIKWPQTMKFVGFGKTKQEASHKAASSAISFLLKERKITKDGQPVLVERSEVKQLIRQTAPKLNLSPDTLQSMKVIVDLYKNEFEPLVTQTLDDKIKHVEGLDDDLESSKMSVKKRVFNMEKYFAKEKVRLPIAEYKDQFIKTLKENRIVIIRGEPGCGKSTRIPQYILESWAKDGLESEEPCQIAVTQPRRIAAVSLADRVAAERDERCGHIVGYQIRLKAEYNPNTARILYCTTGILLKHLQSDLNLPNFTHVILDEAHQRDVNTDLLMNLLKNALLKNPKLKLIVMSATMDVDLFTSYLDNPPVIHIPGFTYPVKSFFLDDLPLNLNKSLNMCSNNQNMAVVPEDVVALIRYIHKSKREGAILCFLPGWEDIAKTQKLLPPCQDMVVLCLHSRLQDSDQRQIFARTPPGVRKVILSTNIAETSVTVDDVVYVVDTGVHKEKRFDSERGINCIDNYWISQSSMIQRKGRAGRVQPGESFHLYTKEKFDSMSPFTAPEITRTSLTKIVLESKVYTNNMDALEFMSHLPTAPEQNVTKAAVRELKDLKLLDDSENLTPLGKTLARFQLEPDVAKTLVNSVVYKCVTPIVDLVTIFSTETELFHSSLTDKERIRRIKMEANENSDHLAVMRLFESWLALREQGDETRARNFCFDTNMSHYKLITVSKLRNLHFDYLHNELHDSLPLLDKYSDNDEFVKAVIFSGTGNLLRHRKWEIVKGRYKQGNVFLTNNNHKATISSDSVNFKNTSLPSNVLIYFNQIRSNIRRTTVIRECSFISPLAVLLFSDKELATEEAASESEDVLFKLKDVRLDVSCTKEEAVQVQKCKDAINAFYEYFIYQLTEGGERNTQISKIWDAVLEELNSILVKQCK